MTELTLEKLLEYREQYKVLPEALEKFANNLDFKKSSRPDHWKKHEPKVTKNSWLLNKKLNNDENEMLYCQFRSILNKLSNSNFNEMAKELIDLKIKTLEHMTKLVDLITNKAIMEDKFCHVYAKLVIELAPYFIKDGDKTIYFRELMINKCQRLFNECITHKKEVELKQDDESMKTKKTIIGCLTFIGELYNNNLLTSKIISTCFILLYKQFLQGMGFIIDGYCVLLRTIYDKYSKSCPKETDDAFQKLEQIKNSGKISIKEKFTIMDIFDCRKKA